MTLCDSHGLAACEVFSSISVIFYVCGWEMIGNMAEKSACLYFCIFFGLVIFLNYKVQFSPHMQHNVIIFQLRRIRIYCITLWRHLVIYIIYSSKKCQVRKMCFSRHSLAFTFISKNWFTDITYALKSIHLYWCVTLIVTKMAGKCFWWCFLVMQEDEGKMGHPSSLFQSTQASVKCQKRISSM